MQIKKHLRQTKRHLRENQRITLEQTRGNLRKKKIPLFSEKLLGSLKNYSQRRDEYIETVRSIIRSNQLDILDNVKLGGDYINIVQPPTI